MPTSEAVAFQELGPMGSGRHGFGVGEVLQKKIATLCLAKLTFSRGTREELNL